MCSTGSYLTLTEKPHIKKLALEIEKVEFNIHDVRKLATDAIDHLEEKKRQMRKEADPNATFNKDPEEDVIDSQILDIDTQKDVILKELTAKHMIVRERKLSIDQLERVVSEMDREISRIQAQQDQTLTDLEEKKVSLMKRLTSIEKLDVLINVLTYKIFETQHDFRTDMDELLRRREELLKRTDLTESQMALALAELERQIADRKNMHEAALTSLEGQRSELRRESVVKTQSMEASADAVKAQHDALLADLEAQKIGATPSQIEEINRRIAELNRMYDKDVEALARLQGQSSPDIDNQDKIAGMLDERGLRVTSTGLFVTESGRLLSASEAETLGLLKGIEVTSWNSILQGSQIEEKHLTTEVSLTEESSSLESSESRMSSEDVHYLKTVLGKPLTLALTEIIAKQPRDPIHYLGHWLFKYRYNQEIDLIKKQEIQDLIDERERLEKEKLHAMIEDEAQKIMLEMIIRAEEEAIRNELERIARETAMLQAEDANDVLVEEAKDVLGVYDGPTSGQPISTK